MFWDTDLLANAQDDHFHYWKCTHIRSHDLKLWRDRRLTRFQKRNWSTSFNAIFDEVVKIRLTHHIDAHSKAPFRLKLANFGLPICSQVPHVNSSIVGCACQKSSVPRLMLLPRARQLCYYLRSPLVTQPIKIFLEPETSPDNLSTVRPKCLAVRTVRPQLDFAVKPCARCMVAITTCDEMMNSCCMRPLKCLGDGKSSVVCMMY